MKRAFVIGMVMSGFILSGFALTGCSEELKLTVTPVKKMLIMFKSKNSARLMFIVRQGFANLS